MGVDHGSDAQEIDRLQRQVRNLNKGYAAGHTTGFISSGTGAYSILIDAGDAGIGEASADYTTAVGTDARATTFSSSAYGFGAEATGDNRATAVGFNALAEGSRSVSFGERSLAQGGPSVAIGSIAKAYQDYGTVVGAESTANGPNATVIGAFSTANYDTSTAVGAGVDTTAANQVMVGSSSERVQIPGRLNVAQRTPSGSADPQGITGDVCWDDNYLYVKTSAGWKRSGLSTF